MNVSAKDKAVKSSAWFLYSLIVLEILFMVSPFAAYYYSIYATPLNALQQTEATAWLTMYVLPHFAYSDSWFANGLILLSWPLILIGLAIFILGFFQIYWAKFTGKGAVERGLYRYIRHPQYVALAVLGLGCSFYWSRFVVVLAFVSMLCLYYYLARTEERICLEKYGDSYREYVARTGMFLPKRWEIQWKAVDIGLPDSGWKRFAAIALVYVLAMGLTVAGLSLTRSHVIGSLQTDAGHAPVVVYLAPPTPETRATVRGLLADAQLRSNGDIAYAAPASWSVPELGLRRTEDVDSASGFAELVHPTTHGNPLSASQDRLNIVIAEAAYADGEQSAELALSRALNLRPLRFLELDVVGRQIVTQRAADGSQWAGIPVPTF